MGRTCNGTKRPGTNWRWDETTINRPTEPFFQNGADPARVPCVLTGSAVITQMCDLYSYMAREPLYPGCRCTLLVHKHMVIVTPAT